MSFEITVKLEKSLYQKLREQTKEDPETLNRFIINAIQEKIDKPAPICLEAKDLKEYVNSAKQGTRKYGAKGQGW